MKRETAVEARDIGEFDSLNKELDVTLDRDAEARYVPVEGRD